MSSRYDIANGLENARECVRRSQSELRIVRELAREGRDEATLRTIAETLFELDQAKELISRRLAGLALGREVAPSADR